MNKHSDHFISVQNLCYAVAEQSKQRVEGSQAHSQLQILNNIEINIQKGQSIAIVGASGSGKSSLLGMLAGLDVPTSGQIFIDGTEITQLDEEQRAAFRAKYVSFVFQNFQLLPTLNSVENVALPLEIRGDSQAYDKAKHYLEEFGLQERIHHLPSKLSGGEQQRVALARAFACDAPIIFADEPTGNLDSITGEKITNLLFKKNAQQQTTLILVTHSTELANQCHEQYEMKAGLLSRKV